MDPLHELRHKCRDGHYSPSAISQTSAETSLLRTQSGKCKIFSKLPRTSQFIQSCWNETVDHMTKICFLVITGLNWQNRQKNLIYNITFIIKRLKSQFQNPNNLLFKAFIGKFKDIHIQALFQCLQDIENKHQIQIFYKKSVLKFIFEKPEK